MQKWIAIGRIDGEPLKVKFEGIDAYLIWVNIPRTWCRSDDSVPVLFTGKRINMLIEEDRKEYSGSLVCVVGELSSRVKVMTKKEINFGCAVFGISLEYWDIEHITNFTKGRPNNDLITFSEREEEEN